MKISHLLMYFLGVYAGLADSLVPLVGWVYWVVLLIGVVFCGWFAHQEERNSA